MNFLTKHIKSISVFLFAVVVIFVFIFSVGNRKTNHTLFVFDTVTDISLSGKNAKKTVELIEDELICIENTYSKFRDSKVSKFNSLAEGQTLELSAETADLIRRCSEISKKTDGAFDITTSALSDLWNIKSATVPPSQAEIDEALLKTGYDKILITGSTVTKTSAQIDLGGIIKGVAADKVRFIAEENGIKSGIVNLGGNVCLIGSNGGKPWTVGIVNPFSPGEVYITLQATDTNIITSGAYQRYFESGGKIYHHILSPQTGYPAQSDVASATVISRDGALADALSTAVFVSGSQKGLELAESFGVDVVIIKKDGSVTATDNIKYELAK